jgi:segregation and condensation protein A
MDIFDLPIAALCEQFLAFLTAMESLDLNIAGEFFVMAATLVEIKSRMLLPPPPKADDSAPDNLSVDDDGVDPRTELVHRLLEYERFQSIAEALKQAETERRALFFRGPIEYTGDYRFPAKFGTLSAADLLRTLERLLASVGAGEQSVTAVRRQKVTLRIKMREIQTLVQKAGEQGLCLTELQPVPPYALYEIVLLFLALLELLKMGSVEVVQEDFCGAIRIFYVPEAGEVRQSAVESLG